MVAKFIWATLKTKIKLSEANGIDLV